ncbi:MAG: fibronectin type III domain-containing protein [Thermoplasmata archaeon]
MRRPPPVSETIRVVLLVMVAATLIFTLPVPPSPGSTGRPAPVAPTPGWASALPVDPSAGSIPATGGPTTVNGPFNAHYYAGTTVGPEGVDNYGTSMVVDTSTDTAYVASAAAGEVTAFAVTDGTVRARATVANFPLGQCTCSLGLDTRHHLLYAGVVVTGPSPAPGWILILDPSTLAVVRNVSVTGYVGGPFEPVSMSFDADTDQMFIENASFARSVALNASTFAPEGFLRCPVASCVAERPTVVPGWHLYVMPTASRSLAIFNTTTDQFASLYTGPAGNATGPVVYDSRDQTLIDFARSGIAPGTSLQRWDVSNGTFEGRSATGPSSVTQPVYDVGHNVVVVADSAASTEISSFNATTGVRVGYYRSPLPTVLDTFFSIAVDPTLGEVIGSGAYGNSTVAFHLPTLTVAHTFDTFPFEQVGGVVDPGLNEVLTSSWRPTAITARSLSTGAPLWTSYLPYALPGAIAVDTALGIVYLANGSAQIPTLNATSGRIGATLTAARQVLAISVDSVHHLLYVAEPQNAEVFSTLSGSAVGNVLLPGRAPCSVLDDAGRLQAYFLNCVPSGNVTTVIGGTPSLGHVFPNLAAPRGGVVLPNGDLDVIVGATSSSIETLHSTTNTTGATIDLAPHVVASLAVDPSANLLFASSVRDATLDVIDVTSGVVLGPMLPSVDAVGLAFDNGTRTLVATSLYRGTLAYFAAVSAPSAPTSVVLTVGNGTLDAAWSPPRGGRLSILGYNASIGTNATGPWLRTQSANRTNVTFRGLTDGTSYDLVITATNAVGVGAPSTPVSATPAGVPYPPVGLVLTGATNHSLNASWQVPVRDGGSPVTNFTLLYAVGAGNATAAVNWTRVNLGTALDFELGSLPEGTNVTVEVQAWNAMGASAVSAAVTSRTLALSDEHGTHPGPSEASFGLIALFVPVVVVVIVVLFLRRRKRAPPPVGSSDGPFLDPPTAPKPPESTASRPPTTETTEPRTDDR